MPKDPRGERRTDVTGNSVKVMPITTGEEMKALPERSAAAELGSKGGTARANLSKKRRAEIAKKAAAKRWARKRDS
jgi:hypothetical protein